MAKEKNTTIEEDMEAAAEAGSDAVSPVLRQKLQSCYEHGMKLSAQAEKRDYDYINTMFTQCVTMDPSNFVYVDAFLTNLNKWHKDKKAKKPKATGSRGALKKAQAAENWDEVLKLGYELLKSNPGDVATLRAMAKACEALHYNEAELRYLKTAIDAKPKDIDTIKHCAESLARVGQFDQAIGCWHRIEEMRRHDNEPKEKISQLTIAKQRFAAGIADPKEAAQQAAQIAAGGKPQTSKSQPSESEEKPSEASSGENAATAIESPPGHSASEDSATRLEDQHSAEGESDAEPPEHTVESLQQAIENDPTEPNNYVALAKLHQREGRFGEAEKVLTDALAAVGNRLDLIQRLEDAKILRAKARVAVAEKRAAAVDDDEEALELVRKLRAEQNRLEIDIYNARVGRFPDRPELNFDLGVRLMRAGNYHEAFKSFEAARRSPQRKAAATLDAGQCLHHLKQYEKALALYEEAVELAGDDPPRLQLALYRAGTLAAGLKQREKAEKNLVRLLEIDPDYKDAASRLDKVRKMSDKK